MSASKTKTSVIQRARSRSKSVAPPTSKEPKPSSAPVADAEFDQTPEALAFLSQFEDESPSGEQNIKSCTIMLTPEACSRIRKLEAEAGKTPSYHLVKRFVTQLVYEKIGLPNPCNEPGADRLPTPIELKEALSKRTLEDQVMNAACSLFIQGYTTSNISRKFTERNLKTKRGCKWYPHTVRSLICRAYQILTASVT